MGSGTEISGKATSGRCSCKLEEGIGYPEGHFSRLEQWTYIGDKYWSQGLKDKKNNWSIDLVHYYLDLVFCGIGLHLCCDNWKTSPISLIFWLRLQGSSGWQCQDCKVWKASFWHKAALFVTCERVVGAYSQQIEEKEGIKARIKYKASIDWSGSSLLLFGFGVLWHRFAPLLWQLEDFLTGSFEFLCAGTRVIWLIHQVHKDWRASHRYRDALFIMFEWVIGAHSQQTEEQEGIKAVESAVKSPYSKAVELLYKTLPRQSTNLSQWYWVLEVFKWLVRVFWAEIPGHLLRYHFPTVWHPVSLQLEYSPYLIDTGHLLRLFGSRWLHLVLERMIFSLAWLCWASVGRWRIGSHSRLGSWLMPLTRSTLISSLARWHCPKSSLMLMEM